MSDDAARTWSGTQVRRENDGPVLVEHKLSLVVTEGPDIGQSCRVEGARLVVGSSPTADLSLSDRTVSRQHLEIRAEERGYVLSDLGSTNGTFVGEARVTEAVIAPGARIQLGESEIVFEPKQKWVRLGKAEVDAFGPLVGRSPAMRRVFAALERIAKTRLSVVVEGETGTGKELVARTLHAKSDRATGPFVVVDCGAISESLAESELFGHEKGAFTGADRARPGAFELAHGGTIFLDEIGELPLDLQPKLLRAIERREVKRLGAAQPIDVDVRVICATHRSLARMQSEGRFREDLYYRVAEVVVELPPLRERPVDIEPIARRILEDESRQIGREVTLAPDALDALGAHGFPGNVRELRNVIRRAAALCDAHALDASALGLAPPSSPTAESVPGDSLVDATLPLKDARDRWNGVLEQQYLRRLLEAAGGDLERAARTAGVHPKSLQRLLRQHGLARGAK